MISIRIRIRISISMLRVMINININMINIIHFDLIGSDPSKETGKEKREHLFELWSCICHGQAVRYSFEG